MAAWDTNKAIAVRRSQEKATPVLADEGLEASRGGARVGGWLCEVIGLDTETVITDAAVVYNLKLGERLVIAESTLGLTTASDSIRAVVGYCTAINGGGDFYPLMRCLYYATGATFFGAEAKDQFCNPKIVVPYDAFYGEAKSVTIRAKTNDAAASAILGWSGWVEKIV